MKTVRNNRQEIDKLIDEVMVDWSLNRLTHIDGNIIRIAVAEMVFLNLDHKVAINEAVEIAQEYSDDDGYRFINGVLRKVSDQLTRIINN
jgi:N utilization substance protein B